MKLNVTVEQKSKTIPMSNTRVGDVFTFDYCGEPQIVMRVFGNRAVSLNHPIRTWSGITAHDIPVELLPSGSKVTIEVL